MKRFLLALLALVSVASAQERQRVELVNISPSLWLKYDAGVTGASGDPVATWSDQSGNSRDFTGTTTTRPVLTRSDNQENFWLSSNQWYDGNVNWWWGSYVTFENNSGGSLDPLGGSTATKVLETADNGEHRWGKASTVGNFTTIAGTAYRFSAYIKPIGDRKLYTKPSGGLPSADVCLYDFTNVTATPGGSATCAIAAVGTNGWFRITHNVTATATSTASYFLFHTYVSSTSFAGDITKGFYCWGGQGQVAAADSTFLATTTTPQYRAPIAGKAGIRFDGVDDYLTTAHAADLDIGALTNATAFGVVVVPDTATGINYVLLGNETLNTKGWIWRLAASTNYPYFRTNQSGANTDLFGTSAVTANTAKVVSLVKTGSSATHYLNNVAVGTGAITSSVSGSPTALLIGLNGSQIFKGTLYELILFNYALPASEQAGIYRYLSFKYGI